MLKSHQNAELNELLVVRQKALIVNLASCIGTALKRVPVGLNNFIHKFHSFVYGQTIESLRKVVLFFTQVIGASR